MPTAWSWRSRSAASHTSDPGDEVEGHVPSRRDAGRTGHSRPQSSAYWPGPAAIAIARFTDGSNDTGRSPVLDAPWRRGHASAYSPRATPALAHRRGGQLHQRRCCASEGTPPRANRDVRGWLQSAPPACRLQSSAAPPHSLTPSGHATIERNSARSRMTGVSSCAGPFSTAPSTRQHHDHFGNSILMHAARFR